MTILVGGDSENNAKSGIKDGNHTSSEIEESRIKAKQSSISCQF
jgi:hypothetical protein